MLQSKMGEQGKRDVEKLLGYFTGAFIDSRRSSRAGCCGRVEEQFATLCSSCHGSDGGGGAYSPNIVDLGTRGTGRRGRENLAEVIRNGTESGMPAFRLPENQVATLVAYIRDLRAPAAERPAPGNAENGARFFAGKGDCMTCHMVRWARRNAWSGVCRISASSAECSRSSRRCVKPGSSGMPGYQVVSIRLLDGSTVRGVARNESTFDLQVQTFDGNLRSFTKSQIAGFTRESKSLMPGVTARDVEVRDLISYLSRLTRENKNTAEIAAASSAGGGLSFEQIVHPKPGEWPTYHGNISGNRHSPLSEINTSNVANLATRNG